MSVVQVLYQWLRDASKPDYCWRRARLYGQLRQLCRLPRLAAMAELEEHWRAHWPQGLGSMRDLQIWAMYAMVRFRLPYFVFWAAPTVYVDGYVRGDGDELLGVRWSSNAPNAPGAPVGLLAHADGRSLRLEISKPFELHYPYSTGWKHNTDAEILFITQGAANLEFKWCFVDQRQTLYCAKRFHRERFAAALQAIAE